MLFLRHFHVVFDVASLLNLANETRANLVARARVPRGGIVRLWKYAEKNQSSIGCFIITQIQKVGID